MVDWLEVQVEYAMAEKSVEELAREHGVGVEQIETRAIDEGWPCEGMHALSLNRQRFVEEYFVDFNGKNAALRAGFTDPSAGARLLRIREVLLAIRARMRDLRHRTNVTQDRVVAQMARIAFGDVRTLFDEKGNLRPVHELSEDESAMIEALDIVEGKAEDGNVLLQTKKVKLASKLQYLERLGKYKGLFNDKIEIEAKVENTGEPTPNDVARRIAFILLQASRKQAEDKEPQP